VEALRSTVILLTENTVTPVAIRLHLARRPSPIGEMLLAWDAAATDTLRVLDFVDYEPRMRQLMRLHYGDTDITEATLPLVFSSALDAYFAGDIAVIDRVAVATDGTPFQKSVWAALRAIPAGTTESYGRLAQRLGSPKAVRAVGGANGANPISIVVPCHRVIGANGTLTGYGGGLDRKKWLLAHETKHAGPQRDLFA
jgi:methylated-DNA-[protein]-cysteine S-methyltransferase